MKRDLTFLALIAASVLAISCGSTPDKAARSSNTGISNVVSNSANAGAPVSGSGTPVPGVQDANAVSNADINAPAAGDVMQQKRREIADVPASGPLPEPSAITAGEDSTISSSMDKSGVAYETRVFKSDPQIAKVQKVISTTGTSVKIYLRNGKVVPVSADKVRALSLVTLANLRELAGIKAPPPATAPSTGTKNLEKLKQQQP